MVFKKKKPVSPAKPKTSDGNPGGVTEEYVSEEKPVINAEEKVKTNNPTITEEQILGYGFIRLLNEVQGLRREQLEIIAIQEKTLTLIASLLEAVREENLSDEELKGVKVE